MPIMKHIAKTIFLCTIISPLLAFATSQSVLASSIASMATNLRIMSFNVRYDSIPDGISVQQSLKGLSRGVPQEPAYYSNTTEQPWSLRRLYVANDILFNKVDLFGSPSILLVQLHSADDVQVVRNCSKDRSMISICCLETSTSGSVSVETMVRRLVNMLPFFTRRKLVHFSLLT